MAKLDWNAPLCTQHETPLIGRFLEVEDRSGRYRVVLICPSTLNPHTTKTTGVWHYDADGTTRQGAGPSDFDLVNYDPEDGRVRINHEGVKIVCSSRAVA